MATDQLPALPVGEAEVVWHDPAADPFPPKAGKIIDASLAFFDKAQIGDSLFTRKQAEAIQREAIEAGKRAAIAADRARAVPVAWREAFEAAMRDAWECADPLHPPGQPGSYARGSWQGMQDGLATLRNNFELRLREAARPPAPEQPAADPFGTDSITAERLKDALANARPLNTDQRSVLFTMVCEADSAQQKFDAEIERLKAQHPADLSGQAATAAGERERFKAWLDGPADGVRGQVATRRMSMTAQAREDAELGWMARASLSTPASGEGWSPAKRAPESPEMGEGWSVTVSRHGVMELTISDEHYCGGRELDEGLIVGAAQHLLAFVGYGLPPCSFDPDDAPTSPTEPAAATWCWSWDEETFHGPADSRDAAAAEVSDAGGWIAQSREPREFISAMRLGRAIYEHVSECLCDEVGEVAENFVMEPSDEERIGKAVLDMIAADPGFDCWGVKAVERVEPSEPAAEGGA